MSAGRPGRWTLPRDAQVSRGLPLLRAPRFALEDESRNVWWLALPSLGESWHNNDPFPISARHGLARYEINLSGLFLDLLDRVGVAWNVVRGRSTARRGSS